MTTSSKKTIAFLPDLCLLTIFDSVPLMDMANVLLTCQRWNSFRYSILTRRTRLQLKLCNRRSKASDCPLWSVLTEERVDLLSCSFVAANIRELIVANHDDSNLQQVHLKTTMTNFLLLLRQWAYKPIHTIAWYTTIFAWSPEMYSFSVPFMQGIGALRVLQVLKLDFWLLKEYAENQTPFPILAQLTCLETRIRSDRIVMFCKWIAANYAHNEQLEIKLLFHFASNTDNGPQISSSEIKQIYQSGAPLPQFTGYFPEPREGELNFEQMHRFLGHFPRLTEFSLLNNRNLGWSEMTRALAQLPDLCRLQITFPTVSWWRFEQLHPLPLVRQLAIRLYATDWHGHKQIDMGFFRRKGKVHSHFYTSLETVFPGLEQLRFVYVREKYVRPIFRPFLKCAKLNVIELKEIYNKSETKYFYRFKR